jgi:peptidyl-prolyl cis-trans isomerase C
MSRRARLRLILPGVHVKRVFVVLSLFAVVVACSKAQTAASANNAAASPAAAAAPAPLKPVPAQLPDVVARVNGENVSKVEFEQALQAIEQRAGRPVPAEQRDQIYRDVLDQLIGFRLMQQEAKSRKIDIAEPELDSRVEAFKQHFGAPEEFVKALAAQNMTLEQFRDQTRSEMRMTKMLDTEVTAKINVQPKDVTDFYEKNPEQFKQPERVRASHILITVAADADANTKAQARTKAQGLLKQAKAGDDFAALATKNSQDPGTAPAGGDLGFFTRGQMVGAFERAAFELKPGTISDLVETPFGFHIIKVVDKQPEKTVSLDEVKPQLEEYLKQQQRQEKTRAFVDSLKNKGKVEILI